MGKLFTISEGLENMGALRSGGQGSVYKARRTGAIVTAVKLLPTPIHSESAQDKNFLAFQSEVEKLKKVNQRPNPHVVKILSSGITETGSLPFIEMEFIEGPDLEELLRPPHPPVFTLKEALKVGEQLSSALAHCHSIGVKHGDIKSNNVKYNIHSGNYVLLDFGLAVMSDEQRRSSLRHAGAIEFMAPEQNEGQMLFQTDVYSFGIVLYELLAGRVPFPLGDRGETGRNSVMLSHMEAPVPDVRALRKEHMPQSWTGEQRGAEERVPDWMVQLINRCLEKDPRKRFSDGQALHAFISQHLLSHTSVAAPYESNNNTNTQQLSTLKQENEKLLRANLQLQQQLDKLNNQSGTPYHQPKKKGLSTAAILAGLLTIFITAVLLFSVLDKKRDKSFLTADADNAQGSQADKQRPIVGQYKVWAQRAYFHNEPDAATRRAAYMIPSNDVVQALDERNGFIYTEFTNSRGQTSKGWLRKQDFITLEDWARNNNKIGEVRATEQDINNQLAEAREQLANNHISEALYIYSYLADQDVPEAMYQYANLALEGKNTVITCADAWLLLANASNKGYIPAKRTMGFLYLFAENNDVLQASQYNRCSYEKNVALGTQLLNQAAVGGDTTAIHLLEEINRMRADEPVVQ